MTTGKWILCVIAASVTSSYATFHLNQPNKNELSDASIIESFSTLKPSTIHSKNEHQKLVQKIDYASNGCDKNVNKVNNSADIGDNNTSDEHQASIEDAQFAYEKKQNEIASFREFIEKSGDSSLNIISGNYESEPIDPVWARSKEDELLALLDTSESFQNTTPIELSCKSQNCRLVLSSHDGNQGESFYSAFKNEALKGSDENKKQAVSYFSNPASGEIHIYLSKSNVSALINGKRE